MHTKTYCLLLHKTTRYWAVIFAPCSSYSEK
uniref:Uncharacterized protein n=1 Tax=Tetraselmis sp. GSL018 TaxID=582737 RepID=A0A061QYN6_9CHLO